MYDHNEFFSYDESEPYDVTATTVSQDPNQNLHKAYPNHDVISGGRVQVNTNETYERLRVFPERQGNGSYINCVLLKPGHLRLENNTYKTDFAVVQRERMQVQQDRPSPYIQGR